MAKYQKNVISKLSDLDDEWQTVTKGSPSKKKNQTKQPQSYQNFSKNEKEEKEENKGIIDPFVLADNKIVIFEKEKNVMNKLFSSVISEKEYNEEIKSMCDKYLTDDDDWYTISEVHSIIIDKKRKEMGLEPILSDTLSTPIVVEIRTENSGETPFPNKIALVCDWQEKKNNGETEWKKNTVAILGHQKEYNDAINEFTQGNTAYGSKFSTALSVNSQTDADRIFSKLISSGKKNSGFKDNDIDADDAVKIDQKDNVTIKKIVAKYNSLFPIWSFFKVNESATKNDELEVPFIRVEKDGKSISVNDININLKDVKSNMLHGIRIMDEKFSEGYLPFLVNDFVNGLLPKEICGIVFSRTIAVKGTIYFKGYRVRVLVNDPKSLQNCKNFLMNDFQNKYSTGTCDYSKCVVVMSLPR